MYMNNDVDNVAQMELEIQKRRDDNDKEVMKILNVIMKKPVSALTREDKAFMKARQSYMSRSEIETFADVLAEDLSDVHANEPTNTPQVPTLMDLTRKELEAKALSLGIQNTSEFANKTLIIEAIEKAQAQ
jgi:hypothetical protein